MKEKPNEKVKVINGVAIRDITPEYTGEELQERVNELARNLIIFAKKQTQKQRGRG